MCFPFRNLHFSFYNERPYSWKIAFALLLYFFLIFMYKTCFNLENFPNNRYKLLTSVFHVVMCTIISQFFAQSYIHWFSNTMCFPSSISGRKMSLRLLGRGYFSLLVNQCSENWNNFLLSLLFGIMLVTSIDSNWDLMGL